METLALIIAGFSVGSIIGHMLGWQNGYERGVNDAVAMEEVTDRIINHE